MNISDRGIALIKDFEGYRQFPYLDVVDKKTVGYGHLIRAGENYDEGLTEGEATKLLCVDCARGETAINQHVIVPLNQNQFDALCSFIFNLGVHAFKTSTLLKMLNAGDYKGAGLQFLRWSKAGGVEVAGLMRRRLAESSLFGEK